MSSIEDFDDETRQVLQQGMSALALQESMGMDTGEMGEIRRREQEELARDMEAKNKANQLRRARMVAGDSLPHSEVEQKPVKGGRRKKGMVKQEIESPIPAEAARQPEPIAPVNALPQQEIPLGLTPEDIALIEQVKASRARSRDTFLDAADTVHPGAVDARPQERQVPDESHLDPVKDYYKFESRKPTLDYTSLPGRVAPAPQEPMDGRKNPEPLWRDMKPAGMQYPNIPPEMLIAGPPEQPMRNAQPLQTGYTREAVEYVQGNAPVAEPVQKPVQKPVQGFPDYRPATYVVPKSMRRFDPGVPEKDFESFTEITGWSSEGLFYPEPVYGQALKTMDADMLSLADDDDITTVITTILGRRLRGISPEDILSADEQYLLYWLRASSVDERENSLPKLPFICEHCKAKYVDAESIAMIPSITFMNLDFETESSPEAVRQMHAAEGFVRFSLLDQRECNIYLRRRKHDREIAEYVSGWEKKNKQLFPPYMQKSLNIAAVVEIEDCDTMSEKMAYIMNSTLAQRRALLKAVVDAQLVSHTKVSFTCPSCGGTVTMPYPFLRERYVAGL